VKQWNSLSCFGSWRVSSFNETWVMCVEVKHIHNASILSVTLKACKHCERFCLNYGGPCRCLDCYLLASHRRGPDYIPAHSLWDLWWTKGQWNRLFICISALLFTVVPPILHSYISFIYHKHYVILEDNTLKVYMSNCPCRKYVI